MNLGQAIEALKAGKRVAREGWNGKGMYIFLNEADFSNENNTEAFIEMYTAQGTFQPGWLASQADMLSEDWEIIR